MINQLQELLPAFDSFPVLFHFVYEILNSESVLSVHLWTELINN